MNLGVFINMIYSKVRTGTSAAEEDDYQLEGTQQASLGAYPNCPAAVRAGEKPIASWKISCDMSFSALLSAAYKRTLPSGTRDHLRHTGLRAS